MSPTYMGLNGWCSRVLPGGVGNDAKNHETLKPSSALTVRPGPKPIELPVDATEFTNYARGDVIGDEILMHTGDT